MQANFILYVRDQELSMRFYSTVLNLNPSLHVPGVTEFRLNNGCVLGLMPEKGIKRLLGDSLPNPEPGNGIPRAELYLTVPEGAAKYHQRALNSGAKELSKLENRDWGDRAAYSLDLDGNVLVFAEKIGS